MGVARAVIGIVNAAMMLRSPVTNLLDSVSLLDVSVQVEPVECRDLASANGWA